MVLVAAGGAWAWQNREKIQTWVGGMRGAQQPDMLPNTGTSHQKNDSQTNTGPTQNLNDPFKAGI
jgi:hypothetical protein